MKSTVKSIFTRDWQLKILALLISLGLWAYVNFGNYVPIEVYKRVHIIHKSDDYIYTVEPKDVILSVLAVDRVLNHKTINDIKAYVDARTLKEGMNISKVNIKTPMPFLVKADISKSTYVRVFVKKKVQK